jgi:hypothetical protein
MLSSILRAKVLSNVAWLISPKIDMDTHMEILTLEPPNIILMWIPFKLAEVFVSSNFDGLNVTKATWIPLKVILPKQATWYQFVGSGGVDLSSYTGKINIAFRYVDGSEGGRRRWVPHHAQTTQQMPICRKPKTHVF